MDVKQETKKFAVSLEIKDLANYPVGNGSSIVMSFKLINKGIETKILDINEYIWKNLSNDIKGRLFDEFIHIMRK